jgi:hypothetical protein
VFVVPKRIEVATRIDKSPSENSHSLEAKKDVLSKTTLLLKMSFAKQTYIITL